MDIIEGNPMPYERRIIKGETVQLGKDDIAHLIALYDGEIQYVDAQIGKLIDSLKDIGLFENSMVIITFDHVEEFFEHNGLKHGYTLYNEGIRIPLIFHLPNLSLSKTALDSLLIQSIDISPTILDFHNIEKPACMQGDSLLSLFSNTPDQWRNFALSESPFIDAKTLITKEWKIIDHFGTVLTSEELSEHYTKGRKLFNLLDDFEEKIDQSHDKTKLFKEMYEKIAFSLNSSRAKSLTRTKTFNF
ncbi:sulfatase [Candidatus Omnitrophota bacterium]